MLRTSRRRHRGRRQSLFRRRWTRRKPFQRSLAGAAVLIPALSHFLLRKHRVWPQFIEVVPTRSRR